MQRQITPPPPRAPAFFHNMKWVFYHTADTTLDSGTGDGGGKRWLSGHPLPFLYSPQAKNSFCHFKWSGEEKKKSKEE